MANSDDITLMLADTKRALQKLQEYAVSDNPVHTAVIAPILDSVEQNLKKLGDLSPEQRQKHQEEFISIMAFVDNLEQTMSKNRDTLKTSMNQLMDQIKIKKSYNKK